MRSVWVWAISSVVVMGAFLIFVAAGWPGAPDPCVRDTPNSCYCEAFEASAVYARTASGDLVGVTRPGVRQKANTWFNLYALGTSLIVALTVAADRKRAPAANVMRSRSPIPDVYVFAVLFLGLGSMWFHASIKRWGGAVDGMSMYVYAAFPPAYTALRLGGGSVAFWAVYAPSVIVMTTIHALAIVPSWLLIGVLVLAYLVLEVWLWVRRGAFAQGRPLTMALWIAAVACILVATLFWLLSQTGGPLCDPDSILQPHALLWHPLAGAMAVCLYFYWRAETAPRSARMA
jgi:hypothetical protein